MKGRMSLVKMKTTVAGILGLGGEMIALFSRRRKKGSVAFNIFRLSNMHGS